jgi:hypothetical protein
MFSDFPGGCLWNLAGDNGSRQLCQHCGDTNTKIEVQSKDEESKEQAGSPSSKLKKYHKLEEDDHSIRGKNSADTISAYIASYIKQLLVACNFQLCY